MLNKLNIKFMNRKNYFYFLMLFLIIGITGPAMAEHFKVTLPSVPGATVSPIGLYNPDRVNKGDAFKFSVVLDEGLEEDTEVLVKAGEEVLTPCSKNIYVVPSVVENVAVDVIINAELYEVTLPSGDGYVTVGDAVAVEGANYVLKVKIEPEYNLSEYNVTATNCSSTKLTESTVLGDEWTIYNVTGIPEIKINGIVRNSYVVSWTNTVGATLNITKGGESVVNGSKIEHGTEIDVKVALEPGYYRQTILVNGERWNSVGGKYIVEKEADFTISDIEIQHHSVIINQPTGAKITVKDGDVDITNWLSETGEYYRPQYGTELTITAAPLTGYTIDTLMVNKLPLIGDKHTVVGLTQISAAVSLTPYIVTIEKTENGVIVVTNEGAIVNSGNEIPYSTELNVRATPIKGYELVQITVNGVKLNGKTVVVKGLTTIAATFSKLDSVHDIDNSTLIVYGVTGNIKIRVNDSDMVDSGLNVVVYDIMGRAVYNGGINSSEMFIPINIPGTYIAQIILNNSLIKTEKLIVK